MPGRITSPPPAPTSLEEDPPLLRVTSTDFATKNISDLVSFKRASTCPSPLPSPTRPTSSSSATSSEILWFPRFRKDKTNTFPVAGGTTSPDAERQRERPLSWFGRCMSPALTEAMSEEGDEGERERDEERVLTTKEEYEGMPRWRREAASERVREMRAWIGIREREM